MVVLIFPRKMVVLILPRRTMTVGYCWLTASLEMLETSLQLSELGKKGLPGFLSTVPLSPLP